MKPAIHLAAVLMFLSSLVSQGITTTKAAVVLYGNASACSQPASVRYGKLQQATTEWKTIKADGVRKGTARYDLLISQMNARIKKAVEKVANAEGCDCVVRLADVKNANGLKVKDLTKEVIAELGG
ncbi:MAG: hypothetical protein H6836_08200 [Planctomycetes bacterium]|nr:hypothetical protein [Planctomycetota bacterium]MCB9889546.1 hypothetical protein [Planctomycetota bacterium]